MSKPTIAELNIKINNLQYENSTLQDKLYDAKVEIRPTIMNKIETIEADCRNTLAYVIKKCEDETGRALLSPIKHELF